MAAEGFKICTRCGETKKLSEFNFKVRATGLRQAHCKSCSQAYVRNHYARNTPYYVRKARTRNARLRRDAYDRILEYFAAHPCADCGESDPVVLDFDHDVAGQKIGNIGDLLRRNAQWQRIETEIVKCTVRCANCHRRRTAQQFGWYKLGPRSSVG